MEEPQQNFALVLSDGRNHHSFLVEGEQAKDRFPAKTLPASLTAGFGPDGESEPATVIQLEKTEWSSGKQGFRARFRSGDVYVRLNVTHLPDGGCCLIDCQLEGLRKPKVRADRWAEFALLKTAAKPANKRGKRTA